jgi:hypothetical protein
MGGKPRLGTRETLLRSAYTKMRDHENDWLTQLTDAEADVLRV